MADVKITELPVAGPGTVGPTDLVPIVKGGVTMQTYAGNISAGGDVWLDTFPGADHDAKLTAAMSYAAAQTYKPRIRLGRGLYTFSQTGRVPYSGFRLAGVPGAGIQTSEQSESNAMTRVNMAVGNGSSSWLVGSGTIYSMGVQDIAFRATNGSSQWLHYPYPGTLYAGSFGNLQFREFYRVMGQPNDGCSITLNTWWGDWNIPNMAGTPFTLRGSDNWLVPNAMNLGWNNGTLGEYILRCENLAKSHIANLYITCRNAGARGILVAAPTPPGDHQGGLTFTNCVIEGQNWNEPARGALIVQTGGGTSWRNICLNFGMADPSIFSPAATAWIQMSGGIMHCSDFFINKANIVNFPAATESNPILRATAGTVKVENFWPQTGNGVTWSALPLVVNAGASTFITDATVRTS